MPIHGPGPLSMSEINTVFGTGVPSNISFNDFRNDDWFVGNFSVPFQNFTTPGKYIFTMPGVPCTGTFEIASGGGGAGGSEIFTGHNGYNGSKLIGTYGFNANDVLTIYVGAGGMAGEGLIGNAQGGAGGGIAPYAGGRGGNSGPTPYSGAGGGGGGASALLVNSIPVFVVGGGGGGGGGGNSSSGLDLTTTSYSTTTTGGVGGTNLSKGAGGGGGGGGNFGGAGGEAGIGNVGGSAGSPGGNILGGWKLIYTDLDGTGKFKYQDEIGNFVEGTSSDNIINGGKQATSPTSLNQTDGGDGYVKFTLVANSLVTGNFGENNVKFSDFFNKDMSPLATTGTETFDTAGTFAFTVPVYKNTFSIVAWGAGGGGGSSDDSGRKGGDTIVSAPSFTLLNVKGGSGGGSGATEIGIGGFGGTVVTGNKVGTNTGKNGQSFTVEGNNAGGDGGGIYGGAGGEGGSAFSPKVANTLYNGTNGDSPGGGGGGTHINKTSGVQIGGGGGGGAYTSYGPVVPSALANGTILTIVVGAGGEGGIVNTDIVGGNGADGKVTITWT